MLNEGVTELCWMKKGPMFDGPKNVDKRGAKLCCMTRGAKLCCKTRGQILYDKEGQNNVG